MILNSLLERLQLRIRWDVVALFSAIALVALLSGCAAYLKFDPMEYQNYVNTKVYADIGEKQCSNPTNTQHNVYLMYLSAEMAFEYQRNRTRVPELIAASEEMVKLAREMETAYRNPHAEPSLAYCKLKFKNISTAAGKLATAIAKKE